MAAHDIEPTILRATGGIHPLDVTFIDDEDLTTPWKCEATTSRKLPRTMPQALANRLIRLAAFQNPEFYKAEPGHKQS
jgi:hypothetical protein